MFDSFVETPGGVLDLTKPSVKGLSHILRNLTRMQPDFIWDYSSCGCCAVEVAHIQWGTEPTYDGLAKALKISSEDSNNIFGGYLAPAPRSSRELRTIRPHHVAAALDKVELCS